MKVIEFIVCLVVAGCVRVPSISEAETAGVATAADSLLSGTDVRELPAAEWPEQIRFLHPESVRLRPDGLYIVTSKWFVEEAGLFVPRQPAFSPVLGGDPEYQRVHGHVFSYHIRG